MMLENVLYYKEYSMKNCTVKNLILVASLVSTYAVAADTTPTLKEKVVKFFSENKTAVTTKVAELVKNNPKTAKVLTYAVPFSAVAGISYVVYTKFIADQE